MGDKKTSAVGSYVAKMVSFSLDRFCLAPAGSDTGGVYDLYIPSSSTKVNFGANAY